MKNLNEKERIMLEIMESTKTTGRIFGVVFQKRSTGQLRSMTCRLGVKKGVKGTGGVYSPSDKKLLPVFEMPQSQFRSIPIEGVKSLTVNGIKITLA